MKYKFIVYNMKYISIRIKEFGRIELSTNKYILYK